MNQHHDIKILIVDDLPEIVFNIDKIIRLSISEVSIEHAFNADDAMVKHDAFIPDFVLLDIKLGTRSGLEVLKHIRDMESESKVLIVTNYIDDFFRKMCFDLGADYFIDKSTEFNQITKILNEIYELPD